MLEKKFDKQVYEPYLFNKICNERADEPVFVNYAPVPPISAVFYLPFAGWKNPLWSKFLFNLCGLLIFLFVYYRFIRYSGLQANWGLLFAPLVFYTPFLNNLLQGQSYLYLLACMLEGYRQWDRKKPLAAGLWWSIPVALKIYPGILLLFLFFRKDFRVLFATIGFSILFSFLPLVFCPPEITSDYFLQILPRLLKGEINDPFSHFHQSAAALFNKLLVFDPQLNPEPVRHQPLLSIGLTWMYQIFLLGAIFLIWSSEKATPFFRFSFSFLAAFLLVNYGSTYSLMLLLPLMMVFTFQKSRFWGLMMGLLALALNFPVYGLTDLNPVLQFPRLFVLILIFGIGVEAIRPKFDGKLMVFSVLIVLFKGLALDSPKPPEGQYYLDDNRYGILYDLNPEGRRIALSFLNEKGIRSDTMIVQDSIWRDLDLSLKNGQVFYQNRQITDSPARKRSPLRLNQHEILYLSDEKRGVGFYTLRRVKMD